MSRLSELIKELCPDGVEYRKLGETVSISRGIRVVRAELQSEGEYPVYQNSLIPMGYYDKSNCSGRTSFIIGAGAAGEIGYSEVDFWAADDCFYFVCEENVNSRFLYHALLGQESLIKGQVRKASIPRLSRPVVEKLLIPVPPLSIQNEIVKLLDNFTELTAELLLRKKQYNFYRDSLLNFATADRFAVQIEGQKNQSISGVGRFSDAFEVKYARLGEIGHFYGGLNGKSKEDFQGGNEPFITYMEVYSNLALKGSLENLVRIGAGECQNTVAYGDIMFTGSSETREECGISCVMTEPLKQKVYLNSFCFGYRFDQSDMLLPAFSKYLFRSKNIRAQIIKTASGVTRFNVSKKKMENVIIPIPPLDVQKKIVSILDRFDALCNDLTQGLPAEIAARKKQYEYYRDKLLTFPRKAV